MTTRWPVATGRSTGTAEFDIAGVTDGLSNTVFASEKTPYLADATWVGIIPGYRHFAYNAFASAGTGGSGINFDYPGAILSSHSGPSLYESPQVIHPPNSPLGHTDEFYSLHPGGANVLMGDGSVRFIKQSINLLAWQALSQPCGRGGDQCRHLLIGSPRAFPRVSSLYARSSDWRPWRAAAAGSQLSEK